MAYQATGFQSFEEMLNHVDALSFAVPPNVQAEMAIIGALAGKALLLEKPIALDLGPANELARVIDEAGVPTQLVLTWRYVAPCPVFSWMQFASVNRSGAVVNFPLEGSWAACLRRRGDLSEDRYGTSVLTWLTSSMQL